jgi:hypothetical protein
MQDRRWESNERVVFKFWPGLGGSGVRLVGELVLDFPSPGRDFAWEPCLEAGDVMEQHRLLAAA